MLAATGPPEWPLDEVLSAVRDGKWNEKEGVFRNLRKAILQTDKDEIEAKAAHAASVWMFLLEFPERRKIYRRQAMECVSVLIDNKAWESVFLQEEALQAKARTLPEDMQAALALQNEALAKSFSEKQMEEFRKRALPQEFEKEQVQKSIVLFREADRLHKDMLREGAEEAVVVPTFGEDAGAAANPVVEELKDAIEAILDIDDRVKWEASSVVAFAQFRRVCLHAVASPEAFEQVSEDAPAVFNFLVDFAKQHKIRIRQICEVLNIIMASPAWAAAFEASPMLVQRVQEELSEEAQASFGLQHEKLMPMMSQAAQRRAKKDAEEGGLIGQAHKVAMNMKTLRQSLAPGGGRKAAGDSSPEDASAESAAEAAAAVPPPPADPKPPDEWREATTPDGRKYYYNVRTRESRWHRPSDTAPGKESSSKASSSTFNVRDKVEVYSNSRQVWCPGVVEKVNGGMVLAAFQLPGAKPDEWARKELAHDDKALRLIRSSSSTASGSTGGYPAGGSSEKTAAVPVAAASAAAASNFTGEEQAAYARDYKASGAEKNPMSIPNFLGQSGLPRRTLKEIWMLGVGAHDGRRAIGLDQFSMCCRLVGHCQAMQRDPSQAKMLNDGGRTLRKFLQSNCLQTPPPALPKFS